ncbi:MAG: class I SAM-dependent methyltransferase [Treponema sp.]|nr:class I SAM-dependent methyltransferase [Treponema sp.]
MENNNSVLEYYESYDEDGRIDRDSLEFIRTKDIVLRNLPKNPIKIIDLCGASGHYAYWLAEMGHEVHLMDLTPKHIDQAKNNQSKYKAKLASMTIGDARFLPYENETFDMVLLMGALYHLQENEDRLKCLREAYRILKNGGTAIFAYISRYASMMDGFKYGYINDPVFCQIMDNDILTGRHNNPENTEGYFTNAYFHTKNEVYNELITAKFSDIIFYGVEGFASLISNSDEYLRDENKLKKLLHYLRLVEQDMEITGISPHWLAVCKKQS